MNPRANSRPLAAATIALVALVAVSGCATAPAPGSAFDVQAGAVSFDIAVLVVFVVTAAVGLDAARGFESGDNPWPLFFAMAGGAVIAVLITFLITIAT